MNFWVKKPYILEKSDDASSTLVGDASFDYIFFQKILGWINKMAQARRPMHGP